MSESEAELLVKTKLENLHSSIKRQDLPDIDWEGIVEDLEALNWLANSDTPSELISGVWHIAERNAASGLKGIARFRVLKLSRAKVFITTVAHTISSVWEDVKEIVTLCKKLIVDFSFFYDANLLLKDSLNTATDFCLVISVYEDVKLQITSSLVHLDKSYALETGKAISKHMDEVFYIKVILPNRTQLVSTPEISTLLSKYNAYPTAKNTSVSHYTTYPYTSFQRDSIYVGELNQDNYREGFGRCTYYNGDSFEGFWRDDRPYGKGVYTWKDGGRYEGNFVEAKMQGKGKRTFVSGAVYEGDFDGGKKHGVGKIRFKNGDVYEGEWDQDDMTGSGVYTWHTGDKFTGKFRRDRREGPGVLKLESGEEIAGEWVDGKMKPAVSSI